MALTSLVLCSRALLRIGAQAVTSLEEGTAEAEVAATLYPAARDALLAAHPWSFATAQASLPRLEGVPLADHAHAFQLPADLLRVLSAGSGRGRGLNYRIHERRLHADVSEVVLTYLFRPEAAVFPPHFSAALVARLAAEFCLPLTESTSRAEMLHRLAESEFRHARLSDSQQHATVALDGFPLIEARR